LLNGLLFCSEHNQRLHVGGADGRYYICPRCQRTAAPALVTHLSRRLALKVVAEMCASLISGDEELVDRVIAYCRAEAERAQRPDPKRLSALKRREEKLTGRIQFILDNAGESPEDQREDAAALSAARAERARLRAEMAALEAAASRQISVPTRADIQALVDDLAAILARASTIADEEKSAAVRMIIAMITGGRIMVTQAGERKPKRGWLRGTFQAHLLQCVVEKASGALVAHSDGIHVEVEFRESPQAEQLADRVKQMRDNGMQMREIAEQLGCHRNLVSKALCLWHTQRGLKAPDGRSTRPRRRRA
jgi:hypothetical protein